MKISSFCFQEISISELLLPAITNFMWSSCTRKHVVSAERVSTGKKNGPSERMNGPSSAKSLERTDAAYLEPKLISIYFEQTITKNWDKYVRDERFNFFSSMQIRLEDTVLVIWGPSSNWQFCNFNFSIINHLKCTNAVVFLWFSLLNRSREVFVPWKLKQRRVIMRQAGSPI